jgi:glutaredoxin
MLELWQTEWCPASRRVRERLTELGVDYVTRQVSVATKPVRRCGM